MGWILLLQSFMFLLNCELNQAVQCSSSYFLDIAGMLRKQFFGTIKTVCLSSWQAVGMYFVTGGDLDYWKSALQDPVPVSSGMGWRWSNLKQLEATWSNWSNWSNYTRKESNQHAGDWLAEIALWVQWRQGWQTSFFCTDGLQGMVSLIRGRDQDW